MLFLPLLFGSLYCISRILDSFEPSCIYLFCCCCGLSWSVVRLPTSWQPGIGYYVDLGGNAEIYIVLDPWVLQMVSEHGFRFLMLFRYKWLSKQRVRKACRTTSLTVIVFSVSKTISAKLFWKKKKTLNRILVFSSSLFYFSSYLICFGVSLFLPLSKC